MNLTDTSKSLLRIATATSSRSLLFGTARDTPRNNPRAAKAPPKQTPSSSETHSSSVSPHRQQNG